MTWTNILIAAISGALGGLTYSIPRIIRDLREQRAQEELTRQQSGMWRVLECAWCGRDFKCRPQDWDACMAQHEATCARQVP